MAGGDEDDDDWLADMAKKNKKRDEELGGKNEGGKDGKKWRGPSTKQWDALKLFMTENKVVLMEPTTTIAFAIRLMRRQWLPSNWHIVTELFTLRKIPLRRLP